MILGSLPGAASLAAAQYYAHPRNQFWELMGALFGASKELPYRSRVARLKRVGVAVWDVFGEATRPGSLDSRIQQAGSLPNALPSLLMRHPGIRLVAFNGATAAKVFEREVKPLLLQNAARLPAFVTLPSTSPAHASMTLQLKLEQWQILKRALTTTSRDA